MRFQRDGEGVSLGWVEFEVPANRVREGVRAAAGNVGPKERDLWCGGVN